MILRPKQIVFSKANTFTKNQINCIKYKEYKLCKAKGIKIVDQNEVYSCKLNQLFLYFWIPRFSLYLRIKRKFRSGMSNSNYPEGRKSIKIAKGAAEVLKSPQYGPLFTKLGD